MSNFRKTLIVIPLLIFIIACQTVTRPLQQAQDTAATAAAFATQAGEFVTQASGLATEIAPVQTFIPQGNPLDPQSPPLSEWKGIPVMPQASAGDESDGTYSYKVAATVQEAKDFYAARLPPLGWEESISMPLGDTAFLVYTMGDETLSITIMLVEDGQLIVMLMRE